MAGKVKIAFVATALVFVSSSAFADLTGKWIADDSRSVYYIRQIGNEVLWYGEQKATSPNWSNVAHGRYAGRRLTLRWADVPKGTIIQHGQLFIEVAGDEKFMKTISKTGGFGGSGINT